MLAEAQGKRVLIVADNATHRRVLGDQLAHAGCEIVGAKDGADALVMLGQAHKEARRFDAVVIDAQLSDMDGAAFAQRVKADASLSHLRLVSLVPLDRQGDAQRFRALGFSACLNKPVRSRELLDCMLAAAGLLRYEHGESCEEAAA